MIKNLGPGKYAVSYETCVIFFNDIKLKKGLQKSDPTCLSCPPGGLDIGLLLEQGSIRCLDNQFANMFMDKMPHKNVFLCDALAKLSGVKFIFDLANASSRKEQRKMLWERLGPKNPADIQLWEPCDECGTEPIGADGLCEECRKKLAK